MNHLRRTALAAFSVCIGWALLPLWAVAATTQGSGRMVTESRTVADFQAIAMAGGIDLTLSQGPSTSVKVEVDDNLAPMLETVVENGDPGPTLKIRWRRGEHIQTRSKVRVTVVTPRLTALSLAGSGDALVGAFKTPSLKLSLSGSGDVKLDGLSTDELSIGIAGHGDVSASGSAAKLSVSIAGSGDVSLKDLRADDVSVRIAGSGDASVNAQKTLEVGIAGSGDVVYTGDPAVKSRVAGSGSVSRR